MTPPPPPPPLAAPAPPVGAPPQPLPSPPSPSPAFDGRPAGHGGAPVDGFRAVASGLSLDPPSGAGAARRSSAHGRSPSRFRARQTAAVPCTGLVRFTGPPLEPATSRPHAANR